MSEDSLNYMYLIAFTNIKLNIIPVCHAATKLNSTNLPVSQASSIMASLSLSPSCTGGVPPLTPSSSSSSSSSLVSIVRPLLNERP